MNNKIKRMVLWEIIKDKKLLIHSKLFFKQLKRIKINKINLVIIVKNFIIKLKKCLKVKNIKHFHGVYGF